MMTLAGWLFLAAWAQGNPGVEDVVRRLRDDSIDVRDRAAEELVDLGKDALPALQALRSTPDPELRGRVLGILRSIEQQETLRRHYRKGPRLRLSVRQVPIGEALRELARQAGDTWKLAPPEGPETLTLDLKEASVFEALDAVCRASPSLTYAFEDDAVVFSRKHRPAYPTIREGEFQIWIDGFGFTQDYDFSGAAHHGFWIGLNVAWERGISPVGVSQRLLQVQDENGNSLLAQDRTQPAIRYEGLKGRFQRNSLSFPLPPGAEGARKLALVKGQVVLVFPKAYEEVILPLSSASSTARLGEATVSIRNLRQSRGNCSFDLIHTFQGTPAEMAGERMSAVQVILLDEAGGEHPATSTHRGTSFGGQSLTLIQSTTANLPPGKVAARARLRLLRESWEKKIPFEFSDLRVE